MRFANHCRCSRCALNQDMHQGPCARKDATVCRIGQVQVSGNKFDLRVLQIRKGFGILFVIAKVNLKTCWCQIPWQRLEYWGLARLEREPYQWNYHCPTTLISIRRSLYIEYQTPLIPEWCRFGQSHTLIWVVVGSSNKQWHKLIQTHCPKSTCLLAHRECLVSWIFPSNLVAILTGILIY